MPKVYIIVHSKHKDVNKFSETVTEPIHKAFKNKEDAYECAYHLMIDDIFDYIKMDEYQQERYQKLEEKSDAADSIDKDNFEKLYTELKEIAEEIYSADENQGAYSKWRKYEMYTVHELLFG